MGSTRACRGAKTITCSGQVYSHLYGIRFIALRFFTVYGPRQRPDLAIHKFAKLMLAGKPIPVFGNGGTSRDYTFIEDIVKGVRGAMEYVSSPYEVINLGNTQTVHLTEMIAGLATPSSRAMCPRPGRTSTRRVRCSDTTRRRPMRRASRGSSNGFATKDTKN